MAKKSKKPRVGGKRAGAGRPKKHPEGHTVVAAWTVPDGLVSRLGELAAEGGISASEVVTEAIREYLAARSK